MTETATNGIAEVAKGKKKKSSNVMPLCFEDNPISVVVSSGSIKCKILKRVRSGKQLLKDVSIIFYY